MLINDRVNIAATAKLQLAIYNGYLCVFPLTEHIEGDVEGVFASLIASDAGVITSIMTTHRQNDQRMNTILVDHNLKMYNNNLQLSSKYNDEIPYIKE